MTAIGGGSGPYGRGVGHKIPSTLPRRKRKPDSGGDRTCTASTQQKDLLDACGNQWIAAKTKLSV